MKFTMKDVDNSIEDIRARHKGERADSRGLLDKLRQSAQKRKGSVVKLPQLKGR